MAGNPFDQFDTSGADGLSRANLFDQFDPPAKYTAVPTGKLATDAPRAAATVADNVMSGLWGLPNLLASGADAVMKALAPQSEPRLREKLESIPNPGRPGVPMFPSAEVIRGTVPNEMGLPVLTPESWAGRRAMDAATGTVGALATGGAGNLRSLASIIGGSMSGGAAAEAFPNHPLAASMLGFIPGAWAANTIGNNAMRVGQTLRGGPHTEPYAAFERLGLPTELGGTTAGTPMLAAAERIGARMPGGEGPIGAARDRLVGAWQNKLTDVADTLGSAATPAELGISLQSAARDWLKTARTNTGDLWNDFRAKVPTDTPTKLSSFSATLDDIAREFPDAPNLAGILQPQLAVRMRGAFDRDTAPPPAPTARATELVDAAGYPVMVGPTPAEMAAYTDALKKSGTLPWQTTQNIRTRLGEMLENAETIEGLPLSAVKKLYGALTTDMEAGAASVSPEAVAAFHRASAATRGMHDLLDNHIGGVLNAASPEKAAQYAMQEARLGGSRLGALTFNLPGAAGDLGSFALRSTAGNADNPSPGALAGALLGRRPALSQESMNVLFPDPKTRAMVGDLATTGSKIAPFEAPVVSRRPEPHSGGGLPRLIAAAELGQAGHEMFGLPGRLGGITLGLASPEAVGKLAQMIALNPRLASYAARKMPVTLESPGILEKFLLSQPLGVNAVPATLPTLTP